MAPEMHSEDARRYRFRDRHPYTPAVDIWSLGVVILELLPRGLPEGTYDGLVWCEKIVDKLNVDLAKAWDSMRQFLADYMVAMKPEDRYSAQQCFEFSAGFFDDGSRTPSQLDYTAHALTRYVEGEQTGFADDSNFTGSRQPLSPGNNSAGSSDNNQSRQSRQTQKRHRSNAPSPSFPPPAPSSKRQAMQSPSWGHSSSTNTANHSRQGVEPRLSQISGLFDPLHELGGAHSSLRWEARTKSGPRSRNHPFFMIHGSLVRHGISSISSIKNRPCSRNRPSPATRRCLTRHRIISTWTRRNMRSHTLFNAHSCLTHSSRSRLRMGNPTHFTIHGCLARRPISGNRALPLQFTNGLNRWEETSNSMIPGRMGRLVLSAEVLTLRGHWTFYRSGPRKNGETLRSAWLRSCMLHSGGLPVPKCLEELERKVSTCL